MKINLPKKMTPELAEEVGLHLGDGSMNYYDGKGFYQLRGHIEDDKDHYNGRIKYLYKKLFNIEIKPRNMPSTGVYGFQIWSDELIDYKSKILGLPLGKKLEFEVPLSIAKNSEFSKSFLRGFFDTDGCLYIENKRGKPYPRIEMASISGKFAKQLRELLPVLGFRVSLYEENREKKGWKNLYHLSIRGYSMTKKWFEEIGPQNPKHILKFKSLAA